MTGHFQLTKAFKSFPFTLLHTLLHGAKINPLLFNRFRTLCQKLVQAHDILYRLSLDILYTSARFARRR